MFGPFRRFPFRGLALVALGFLAASVLAGNGGGVAAGLGLLLLIPLFLFKAMFFFLVLGTFLRFAGGGWGRGWDRSDWQRGGWDRRGDWGGPGPWGHRGRRPSPPADDPDADQERRDWEESLRQAKEELRQYDNPFSRPPEGFEPPADERDG